MINFDHYKMIEIEEGGVVSFFKKFYDVFLYMVLFRFVVVTECVL